MFWSQAVESQWKHNREMYEGVAQRRKQNIGYKNVRQSDSDTNFCQPDNCFRRLWQADATKVKIPKLLVGKRNVLFLYVWLNQLLRDTKQLQYHTLRWQWARGRKWNWTLAESVVWTVGNVCIINLSAFDKKIQPPLLFHACQRSWVYLLTHRPHRTNTSVSFS